MLFVGEGQIWGSVLRGNTIFVLDMVSLRGILAIQGDLSKNLLDIRIQSSGHRLGR